MKVPLEVFGRLLFQHEAPASEQVKDSQFHSQGLRTQILGYCGLVSLQHNRSRNPNRLGDNNMNVIQSRVDLVLRPVT